MQFATDAIGRKQYLTEWVLILMVTALSLFTLLVAAGWIIGMFVWGDLAIMLVLDAPTVVCWVLARRGRWQWGSYLAPLLMFGLGAFGSSIGWHTSFVVFYGLAILLTGMLVGNLAQWGTVGLCIITHVGLASTYEPRSLGDQLAVTITLSGGFVGIALLQWFSTRQLQLALIQARATTADLLIEITERQQAEAEREALVADLEAKNTELERFTYTVSHDLKSPLISISGFVGFLEQDTQTGNLERVKEDIVQINNAVAKMQRLLNELLELSRVGRLMNPPEEVSFTDIAHEAIEMVHGRIEACGVQVEIAPDLPTVHGDRARLVEVMQNLIDNACKFMGEQPDPKLEIGARQDDGEAVFYVRDNGIGVDPQYHDKIFGLFDKLDPQSEGTGIGLALVKRIVEIHGGRIWVESEVGAGSTFCFTLAEIR